MITKLLSRRRLMRPFYSALAVLFSASFAPAQTVPTWVGPATHIWTPKLGGGIWYEESNVVYNIRQALTNYPQPVLVGLRGDICENGYRFDLNRWDTSDPHMANFFVPFSDQCSQECVLQTLEGTSNVQFIWSMPVPTNNTAEPYSAAFTHGVTGGNTAWFAYPWQKSNYYAAYLQYLIEPTNMSLLQIEDKITNTAISFFTDTNCTTEDTNTEITVLSSNWGNLRAARGHPEPYNIQAVVLGIEPYGNAVNEGMWSDGAAYGAIAEAYRNAIRARAVSTNDPMAAIPLGLHCPDYGNMDDFGRPWFKPMMDAVSNHLSDFSYMDMHHEYWSGSYNSNDFQEHLWPTIINVQPPSPPTSYSSGWEDYWTTETNWKADFTRYLWWYDDINAAITEYNDDPSRWNIGCAEHGLAGTTEGRNGNDMGGGISWALWLAETMRYDANWDMNWVLCEQGGSAAQLQWVNTNLTHTPAYYVYKMAQEFYGYDYHTNSYVSPTGTTGVTDGGDFQGTDYYSPDVEVRVFYNSTNGDYHLFVINQNPTTNATISGWTNWIISGWNQLHAANYTNWNPLGVPGPEPIQTSNLVHVTTQPLVIPPISVNHIVLSSNLINIQFGLPTNSLAGLAALGDGTNDYWNILGTQKDFTGREPLPGNPWFATNCLNYAGNNIGDFAAAVYCNGTDDNVEPSSGPNPAILPFAGTIATVYGSDFQIELTMPAGIYDVYLYAAYPYMDGYLPVTFTYNDVEKSVSTSSYSLSAYTEGNQYVVFRNITFSASTTAVFNVSSTLEPVLNGIQILVH